MSVYRTIGPLVFGLNSAWKTQIVKFKLNFLVHVSVDFVNKRFWIFKIGRYMYILFSVTLRCIVFQMIQKKWLFS